MSPSVVCLSPIEENGRNEKVGWSERPSSSVEVKVSLEQATKAQRGSRCMALLFL
jgi:hypothetical protein